jgi:hypothetical protein
MLGGERDPGRVGAGQRAALERLDDHASPVEHARLDAPRQQLTLQGAAVAAVA